jgi:hypothetical protein
MIKVDMKNVEVLKENTDQEITAEHLKNNISKHAPPSVIRIKTISYAKTPKLGESEVLGTG